MAVEYSLPSLFGFQSRGTDTVAKFVDKQRNEGRRRLNESARLGLADALEELNRVVSECQRSNWDGDGASPVFPDSFDLAMEFLYGLPIGTPVPAVEVHPDGQIAFEWYSSPRQILDVSMCPDGRIAYSALIGSDTSYGTRFFAGSVPLTILDLIRDTCGA
jgi:hypothetical protein